MLPLWARVDLGAMAVKGYSAFLKASAILEPHYLCHIQDTRCGGWSYPFAEVLSVYSTAPADWTRLLFLVIWNHIIPWKKKKTDFDTVKCCYAVKPTAQPSPFFSLMDIKDFIFFQTTPTNDQIYQNSKQPCPPCVKQVMGAFSHLREIWSPHVIKRRFTLSAVRHLYNLPPGGLEPTSRHSISGSTLNFRYSQVGI